MNCMEWTLLVHNLFGCDDPVTIRVANQSSSVTFSIGGYLGSLGEGSPSLVLFPSLA